MSEHTPKKKFVLEASGLTGFLWFVGWLFSIGFAQLSFGQGLLAVVLWPYYVGAALVPSAAG